MNSFNLSGRVAVVPGGNGGSGLAMEVWRPGLLWSHTLVYSGLLRSIPACSVKEYMYSNVSICSLNATACSSRCCKV